MLTFLIMDKETMPVGRNRRILQLLSAEIGWFVRFRHAQGGVVYERIICWALMESDEGGGASMTYVDGMIDEVIGIVSVVDTENKGTFVFKDKDFVPMYCERVKD